MINAAIYTETLGAGVAVHRLFQGSFFKILSSTGAVNVRTANVNLSGLIGGQGFEKAPFDFVELQDASGASNVIRYIVATEGFIDGLSGTMTIGANSIAKSGGFTNAAATVTSASASLLAANASRQYLLIQNRDPAGTIYVNFGAAATVANGIKIAPGGAYESGGIVSTQQLFAIGDIASNTNILTVQG
jgi:hypothetical protein